VYFRFIKPLLDYLGAAALVLLFSPVLLGVAILIYIKMGRPLFFRQERPSKNEKIFTIYKFRTMHMGIGDDKARLTPLGKTLRSLSLDELPQLFNILKGEMSFIGPRPLLIEYLPLYTPEQKLRHGVKPGITGWAQVNGRNAISWKKKFEYDVWYTKNISFMLDVKIVLLTIKKVFTRQDISSNTHVTSEKFNGHN